MSRVIAITGASAGVGRAAAHRFAREGAKIGLIARGSERLQAARREVEELGGEALVVIADVADAHAVETAAKAIEDTFGPIDVWVNNAMASVFSTVKEMTAEEYKRVTEVTYLGYVHGTLSALRRMQSRESGIIIQVGSALAYRGIPLQSAYCAAKHAVQGFCDSLRCELIHDKSRVRISMVQMPALNTPQFGWVKSRLERKGQPVPPIYDPDVAAQAIYHMSLHPRREMWVAVPSVKAILGNKLIPGLLDHYLAATGYEGQQTEEPENPDRPHNLWEPPPGDPGTRGTFGDRSRKWSPQLWLNIHRNRLAAAAVTVLSLGIAASLVNRR